MTITTKDDAAKAYKIASGLIGKNTRAALKSFIEIQVFYADTLPKLTHNVLYCIGLCYKDLTNYPQAIASFQACFDIRNTTYGANDKKTIAAQTQIKKSNVADDKLKQTERNYVDTHDKKYIYVPQNHAAILSETNTERSGLVTDDFSSCVMVCLENKETRESALVHCSSSNTQTELLALIKRMGGDACSKTVVMRNPATSQAMLAQTNLIIAHTALGRELFDKCNKIFVDDNVANIVISKTGVHCLTEKEFKGKQDVHSKSLGIHIFGKLNCLFDPVIAHHAPHREFIIFDKNTWKTMPKHDTDGSVDTQKIISTMRLKQTDSINVSYDKLSDYVKTKGLAKKLQLTGNNLENWLMVNAVHLQWTVFLDEKDSLLYLKTGLKHQVKLESEAVFTSQEGTSFFTVLKNSTNNVTSMTYSTLLAAVTNAKNTMAFNTDYSFQMMVRSTAQTLENVKRYDSWLPLPEAPKPGPRA